MERLTERLDGDGLCYGKVDCEDNCTYCDRFLKVLDKLADYEDAEEQGMLLRLPCPIGSTVYVIVEEWEEIYEPSSAYYDIYEEPFTPYMLEGVGKDVFLTREEAEQALAEMQKG